MNSEYNGIVTSDDWLCAQCGKRRAEHPCGGFQRRHRAFVAMLRVKNESRWIEEVLTSLTPLCDEIFVMDDHSTDNTEAIARSFEKVKFYRSPFVGLNESRDKNWLYDQILARCEPEWIVCVDGDEVLEKSGPDIIRQTCLNGDRQSYSLPIAFLWNDPHTVRVDRIYGDFWRPSIFKPFIERSHIADDRQLLSEFRFKCTPFGRQVNQDQPNLHCSSVPQRLIHGRGLCPARLKHYGYMERSARVRKLDYYTSIDWLDLAEDCYRHMCQADNVQPHELPRAMELVGRGILNPADIAFLCNTPAEMRLLHAGPIQLVPWDEDKPLEVTAWARAQHGLA